VLFPGQVPPAEGQPILACQAVQRAARLVELRLGLAERQPARDCRAQGR